MYSEKLNHTFKELGSLGLGYLYHGGNEERLLSGCLAAAWIMRAFIGSPSR